MNVYTYGHTYVYIYASSHLWRGARLPRVLCDRRRRPWSAGVIVPEPALPRSPTRRPSPRATPSLPFYVCVLESRTHTSNAYSVILASAFVFAFSLVRAVSRLVLSLSGPDRSIGGGPEVQSMSVYRPATTLPSQWCSDPPNGHM